MRELSVEKRAGELRCVVCHDRLSRGRTECAFCHATFHYDCRIELGRCPTLGCRASQRHDGETKPSDGKAHEAAQAAVAHDAQASTPHAVAAHASAPRASPLQTQAPARPRKRALFARTRLWTRLVLEESVVAFIPLLGTAFMLALIVMTAQTTEPGQWISLWTIRGIGGGLVGLAFCAYWLIKILASAFGAARDVREILARTDKLAPTPMTLVTGSSFVGRGRHVEAALVPVDESNRLRLALNLDLATASWLRGLETGTKVPVWVHGDLKEGALVIESEHGQLFAAEPFVITRFVR